MSEPYVMIVDDEETFFDYLMKPCDIDELMSKVHQAAEKKKAHEEKIKEAAVKNALSSYGD